MYGDDSSFFQALYECGAAFIGKYGLILHDRSGLPKHT
jgi:hypothetical protein